MSIPVGIDLGTTYSAIAFVDEFGKPVCIQNDSGDFITPSIIYIDERVIRVGKAAEYMERQHPERVARFVKQQMGKRDWQFIDCVGAEWAPETLSALLLKKLKQTAEAYLEDEVHDVVISVPAYFMDHQRQATIDAGKIAGLNVVSIVNEPTAAALAFAGTSSVDKQQADEETYLVYDLGGGTFDVTVLEKTPERLRVLGTAGNVELGGANIDYQVMEVIAEAFENEHGVDPRTEKGGELLLRREATELKEALTQVPAASTQIHYEGKALSFILDRKELRALSANLLDLTRITVLNLLDELELSWDAIDRLLLAGGSTYSPMVREMLNEISGKTPSTHVNADQAVALGTAVWARSQQTFQGITEDRVEVEDERRNIPSIQDVASHSLGTLVESPLGKPLVDVIVPRNSPLPAQNTRIYATVVDKQKAMKIEVYQGEDPEPEFCRMLGESVFGPLPPYLSGSPIEVTFAYDLNGIIQVTAIDPQTEQRLDFEVRNSSEAPSEFLELQRQLIESRTLE